MHKLLGTLRKNLAKRLRTAYDEIAKKIFLLESGKLQEEKEAAARRTFLAFRVLSLRAMQNLIEFSIIVFLDPAQSFMILKKRDEFMLAPVSYVEHRLYTKKLKLFSLGSVSLVVMMSLMVSLITSYVFPHFRSFAATFTWTQTDWSAGVGGPPAPFPKDPDDRTDWKKFSSKDQTVVTSTGAITVADFILGSDTTDTDFASGTQSFTAVTGQGASGSVILSIPQ